VEIVGLDCEIQFAQQALAQVDKHIVELIAPAEFCMLIEKMCHLAQCLEIANDEISNVRSLHLNHNVATVAHVGTVHLG
jgi:hypothetical protein